MQLNGIKPLHQSTPKKKERKSLKRRSIEDIVDALSTLAASKRLAMHTTYPISGKENVVEDPKDKSAETEQTAFDQNIVLGLPEINSATQNIPTAPRSKDATKIISRSRIPVLKNPESAISRRPAAVPASQYSESGTFVQTEAIPKKTNAKTPARKFIRIAKKNGF